MKRTAFTLVELLTVIAIIGILIGLLLPAVQMVRESARRAACQNKIRQIALGLENFHAQRNRFPYGWNQEGGVGDSGWSWMAYNLPFVEQQVLYDSIDFNIRVTDPSFESTVTKRIPMLFCPSSVDEKISTFELDGELPNNLSNEDVFQFPVSIARTQYVGCVGSILSRDQIADGL